MEKETGQQRRNDEPGPPISDECISLELLSTGFQEQAEGHGKDTNQIKNIEFLPQNNPTVMKALSQNEDGDAYLYTELFRNKFVFDCSQKNWYRWNGHHWVVDIEKEHMKRVKEVIKLYETQLVYEQFHLDLALSKDNKSVASTHEANVKRLKERIVGLQSLGRKKNITQLSAAGIDTLAYHGRSWDNKKMLFPCINGTINLETGEFYPGEPQDYMTKATAVEWKGIEEACPTWIEFINSIFGYDKELIGFMHRLLGYGITGRIDEHVYPILWGAKGRNGKSTMLETIKFVLGELAYKLPATYFMVQPGPKPSGSSDAETMALRGRRLVWGSETNQKDKLNVAKIKELVGGDTLSAREPYGRYQVTFEPTHLLLLLTNRRPKVPADDAALWERIKLIPFLYSFVKNPDPKDPYQKQEIPNLIEKLKDEASGILAWLVQGCIWWQEIGLQPPESVNTATTQYRDAEDIIGLFIKEVCFVGNPENTMYRVSSKHLYEAYKSWCEEVGHHALAKKHFTDAIKERFEYVKEGTWFFAGITIAT